MSSNDGMADGGRELAKALAGLELSRLAMELLAESPDSPAPCDDWPAVREDLKHMAWVLGWMRQSLWWAAAKDVHRLADSLSGEAWQR